MIPAIPEHQPVLANLLELYVHDFSEFFDVPLGLDGRFGYPHLPLYWSEPERHPFLVYVDGRLAGFAFVKRVSGGAVWDMAEFFIVRGCRQRGVGTAVAHEVWRRFPGPWQVRVMESNVAAARFWERAVSRFLGVPAPYARVETNGRWWRVFSFESQPRP